MTQREGTEAQLEPVSLIGSPLLERQRELTTIEAALSAARSGEGRLLLIEGPPGIGKSSLLAATREQAREAGFAVLAADCDELEAPFPFGVAINLLEPAVSGDHAEALFEGPAGLSAALFGRGEPAGPPDSPDAAFARVRGLTGLCSSLSAHGPVLLCIDDAHWADSPSLVWLRYLARRLDGLRLLLAVATRTGEPSPGDEVPAMLRAASDPLVLRPAALSEAAAFELARSALTEDPGRELAAACHRASGGNPFFLRELLAELATMEPGDRQGRVGEVVPEKVARAIAARLARLPGTARRLARSLAVLAEPTEPLRAAVVAGLDPDQVRTAGDALIASGLLGAELPLRFSHPLVRGAVHDEIPPADRARLHRRAAQALAEERAAPERIAGHLLESDPDGSGWAVRALRRSAAHAQANGDPVAAVRLLERALAERPGERERGELLLEMGRAQIEAGRAESIDSLKAALELDAGPDCAELLRELGRALAVFARLEESASAFDGASSAAEGRRDLQLEIEAELASIQLTLGAGGGVGERLARHRAGLRGESGGERMLMAVASFSDAQGNRPSAPCAELAERALRGWSEHGLRSASLCFYEGVLTLMYADRYERAEGFLDEAIRDARARGSLTGFANASWLLAWSSLRCGRLAEAEAQVAAAQEAMQEVDEEAGASTPLLRGVLVETRVERGDLDGAQAVLGEEEEGEIPGVSICNPLRYARGLYRIALGRRREGVADLLEAGRLEAAVGGVTPAVFPWRSTAAIALASEGEVQHARDLVRDALTLTRKFGAPRPLGIALRASGVVGGTDAGIEQLRESVAILEDSPARLEHSRALVDLGAALRRSGRRREARDPLRQAVDLAGRCGALPLVERARDELVASGARPRRSALRGPAALTPGETRVARLAAEGRSNQDIANELFITVRTVEGHLSRAYAKLEIGSRAELADALRSPAPA